MAGSHSKKNHCKIERMQNSCLSCLAIGLELVFIPLLSPSSLTMSQEQLDALLAKLKEDNTLQERLQAVNCAEEAAEIVSQAGFEVSIEELLAHRASTAGELSDAELEGVAGGSDTDCYGSCPSSAQC